MFFDPEGGRQLSGPAARAIGALLGVIASIIMVAPEGTRNAFARLWIGIVGGFIFAPSVANIPFLGFLSGDDIDMAMARGAFTGFSIWFVLEFIARAASSEHWIALLAKEVLRLNGKKDGK